VPYADHIAFPVPDEVDDQTAVFASDSAPTGWMGADLGGVRPGDVVAVWGCGAVGQMAARAAILLGAERVIAIDRFNYRLEMTEMNKGLTLRGAQQHGERYIPMLLERMARGELKTAHLETHPMPLDEGPRGYDLFKNKKAACGGVPTGRVTDGVMPAACPSRGGFASRTPGGGCRGSGRSS
jgi:threonine dehydrogenase-like Zn-dependent dehydrogenase